MPCKPEEVFIYGHASGKTIVQQPLDEAAAEFTPPSKRPTPETTPAHAETVLFYQSESVERSIATTHTVGVFRDRTGTDGESFGLQAAAVGVRVFDARGFHCTLDEHGFAHVDQGPSSPYQIEHIDYSNHSAVVGEYYEQCSRLVRRYTGATKVVAFDHNIRGKVKAKMDISKMPISFKDGNRQAVQGPLFGRFISPAIVHAHIHKKHILVFICQPFTPLCVCASAQDPTAIIA
jgi:hypothetical protein